MKALKKFALTLDLKNDASLIAEYEHWHRHVWPEIKESILAAGIVNMEIYRFSNRLFMVMETDASFSFERKQAMDSSNAKVKEWEEFMWKFQQPLPDAKPGEKWMLMTKIFSLHEESNDD